jgi:hypothetical protein
MSNNQKIISQVRHWIETVVIGLNLCPFAKSVYRKSKLRYVVSESKGIDALMYELYQQCRYLVETPEIETTLLIIPRQLQAFADFNQVLDLVDALIEEYEWAGVFQIASFHPKYQFANTRLEDRQNWSNRSPFPILHILRESSVELALSRYQDPGEIPEVNIAKLEAMDKTEFDHIFNPENAFK